MVRPWAEAGYRCKCFDIRHEEPHVEEFPSGGRIEFTWADLRNYGLVRSIIQHGGYRIGFAFPDCTNGAVSGARWLAEKGLRALAEYIELVASCHEILEGAKVPYLIENPVSTLSTYWRKPDYTFHPWQYAQHEPADRYPKKTCLWTGNGFVMPEPKPLEPTDDRIHRMPPGEDRADLRSVTPRGFARAVFEANCKLEAEAQSRGTQLGS
jgi:hypothetical protein